MYLFVASLFVSRIQGHGPVKWPEPVVPSLRPWLYRFWSTSTTARSQSSESTVRPWEFLMCKLCQIILSYWYILTGHIWNMKHIEFSQIVREFVRIIQLPLDRALGSLWQGTGSPAPPDVGKMSPLGGLSTLMKLRSVTPIVRESDKVTKWQWVELENQRYQRSYFFWKALITAHFTHFSSKCQEPHVGGVQNLEPLQSPPAHTWR